MNTAIKITALLISSRISNSKAEYWDLLTSEVPDAIQSEASVRQVNSPFHLKSCLTFIHTFECINSLQNTLKVDSLCT